MHMADALLSPAVGGTMIAFSAGLISYSVNTVRKSYSERRIPLMGVLGAFIFASQMINFSIPGTGSSGHIGGGLLLAALLGPAPAFMVMASVLLVQALFFADGGLLALGCNLFNMGFFSCFVAYPYVFRPIAGDGSKPIRIFIASCVASVVGLELGAFCVTLETLVSGVTQLPFSVFAAAMLPIHVAIGLIEGIATGAVLLFVKGNLPDFSTLKLESKAFSLTTISGVFGLSAIVIGGGLSLLASSNPDGLEWSMERVAGSTELQANGPIYSVLDTISQRLAFLPDYSIPGSESVFGTSVSGIVGALICSMLLVGIALILCKFRHHSPEVSDESE